MSLPDPSSPPQPGPSGALSKTVAVLAVLGAIANAGLAALLVAVSGEGRARTAMPDWYPETIYYIAAGDAIVAAVLLTGGVITFTRRRLGPWVVAAGCALCIVVFFGDLAATVTAAHEAGSGSRIRTAPIHYVAGLFFPVATLVLAVLPATRRYCTR